MSIVTVIVPCYNAAEYIEKSISAFAEQTFTDFDVVFVDDCSKDRTVETVQELIKKYGINGKIIKNKKNTGPSGARKLGIESSDSEYIAFCDSDDWYSKDFLSKMIEASNDSTNDIVFCNYNLVYSNGRTICKDCLGDVSRFSSTKKVLTISVDGLWGGLFKRALFEKIDFPDIRNGEDMAIIPVLISKSNSFGFVQEGIYNYFQREGSLSTSQSERVIEGLRKSFEHICNNINCVLYRDEVEFLGMRNVLYGALLTLFKLKIDRDLFIDIVTEYEKHYPNWIGNPYYASLPTYKRIFLKFVKLRWGFPLKILSIMHTVLTK